MNLEQAQKIALWLVVCSLLSVIGCWLPWIHLNDLEFSGIRGDGVVCLGASLAVMLLSLAVLVKRSSTRLLGFGVLAASLVSALLSVLNLTVMLFRYANGLLITLVAATAVLVLSFIFVIRKTSALVRTLAWGGMYASIAVIAVLIALFLVSSAWESLWTSASLTLGFAHDLNHASNLLAAAMIELPAEVFLFGIGGIMPSGQAITEGAMLPGLVAELNSGTVSGNLIPGSGLIMASFGSIGSLYFGWQLAGTG